jgi:DNA-binding PucR family transcriptional regulator
VAADLGRKGWIGDPRSLALETTFLLDARLARAAIDQELGSILADERMGPELIRTLETYLGARQNIRKTAALLDLSPRTVAYRLERIQTLLGRSLEGGLSMRLGAALMALSVLRQAGTK